MGALMATGGGSGAASTAAGGSASTAAGGSLSAAPGMAAGASAGGSMVGGASMGGVASSVLSASSGGDMVIPNLPGSMLYPDESGQVDAVSAAGGGVSDIIGYLKESLMGGAEKAQDLFGMNMSYEKAAAMADESGLEKYSGEWWDVFDAAGSPDNEDGSPKTDRKAFWRKFGAALKGAGAAMEGVPPKIQKSSASVTAQNPFQGSSQPAKNPAIELLLQSLGNNMMGSRK